MRSFDPRRSLSIRALLLLAAITVICIGEVTLALSFKNDLKRDFFEVTDFSQREKDYLLALVVSSELAHELSLPATGMVFLRVGYWNRRLDILSAIEKRWNLTNSPTRNGQNFENISLRMREMTRAQTTDLELADFTKAVKKSINVFSLDIHQRLEELKVNRATLIDLYGKKTDFYATILLGIGLLGFSIIASAAAVFLTGLLKSVSQLANRAKEIARGEYGTPLITNRRDEIGLLVDSVNSMAAALDRREKEVEDFRRRLFQQEKMFTIGSFAAGIAHEVGNPMQAIVAANGQVLQSLNEDPTADNINDNLQLLEMINEQAQRLNTVVHEIREFAHTGEAETQLIDTNEVIETTLRLMRFDRRFKTISVQSDLDTSIPAIEGVSDHLTQVLINLLVNAADAIDHDHGEILVVNRLVGENVVITVSDNGHGMSQEVIDEATEPFFTTKERGKGTGLGLAVCKQIVDDHSGKLTIQSAQNEGTIVTLVFPGFRPSADERRLAG